jgi:amino acid transporter
MTFLAWIVGMLIVAVFAYLRGWKRLPRWERWFVWFALGVVAITWLMPLSLIVSIFKTPLRYGFYGLMIAYMVAIWGGIAVGLIVLTQIFLTDKTSDPERRSE